MLRFLKKLFFPTNNYALIKNISSIIEVKPILYVKKDSKRVKVCNDFLKNP